MNKIIIMIMSGIVFIPLFVQASDIFITAGSCQTFLLWNSTDSTSYNQTVCGGFFQWNMNKTLNYNEVFNITQENVFITAPANTSAKCFIRASIAGNFSQKSENCDVEVGIENLTNYMTNFTYEITPKEEEEIKIENYTNFCSINMTVKGYPEQFKLPVNNTIIPQAQYDLFSKNLEKGFSVVEQAMKCTETLGVVRSDNIRLGSELADAKNRRCGVSDATLLNGWKMLFPNEIETLRYFANIENPTNSLQLVKNMESGKNMTKDEFNYKRYYVEQSLKKYYDIGFAELRERTYWSETLQSNTTDYMYYPLVSEYCLNRTSDLMSIERRANEAGMQGTFFFETAIVGSFIFFIWFKARKPNHRPTF